MPNANPVDGDAGAPDTQTANLIQLCRQKCRLGVSTDGLPFAVGLSDGRCFRLNRSRRGLGPMLAELYYEDYGRVPSSNAISDALQVLEIHARRNVPEAVHLRAARSGRRLVVDLATPENHRVVIRNGSWKVRRGSRELFWSNDLLGPQVIPRSDGSIELLRQFLNVSDDDWLLVLGWLVAALIPDIARPILLINGEQGTGKTTAERTLRRLIDPSPVATTSLPTRVGDFPALAGSSFFLAFDNVRYISPSMSDTLCTTVTGDAHVVRTLYTEHDTSYVVFKRVIAIDGIDLPALRGDLSDRMVPIRLQRIQPRDRRPESEMDRRFDSRLPRMLGGLFSLLAEVLQRLDGVHLAEMPRMADFARVLAAIDEIRSTDSLNLYLRSREALATEVLESDGVALAVMNLVNEEGRWRGTASQLLSAVAPDHLPRGWPDTPRKLSQRLREAQPTLRTMGVEMAFTRASGGNRARLITITRS